MANKRQRLAKRRFSGTQQGATTKRKEPVALPASKDQTRLKPSGNKLSNKHPLRVAGKKPGDGCFICKSTDHVAKACPQKLGKDRKMICLACRKMGHTLKNCPNKGNGLEKKCYNCGGSGHRLAECKEPLKAGGTTFASCFLCNKEGHLSKHCPSNKHGIYPKGGSCKVCGGVTHLAKDCPKKDHNTSKQQSKLAISKEVPITGNSAKRIVFTSGDDFEDDFVEMEGKRSEDSSGETDLLKPKGRHKKRKDTEIDHSFLKPIVKKARKSPKVVNFK